MESFTILTSSAILLITLFYTPFHNKTLQNDWVWRAIASEVQKLSIVTREFYNSYTEDEPNFPRQNNLILQKKVSGVDKVVNFKGFLRPDKKIKYFSRTKTEFKDFSRRLVKFKTFSRLYEPCKQLFCKIRQSFLVACKAGRISGFCC